MNRQKPYPVSHNSEWKDKEYRDDKNVHQKLFKSVHGFGMIAPKFETAVIRMAMQY